MNRAIVTTLAGITVVCAPALAQTRRATFTGNGNSDRGKCTIEVVVDGAAEVDVRGDTATLRDLSGRRPQWRRFECTGPMPADPADFRFAGVDGRGNQRLVRDPRNSGGVAAVRIQDPEGGAEGYTFDLFWANNGYPTGTYAPNAYPGYPAQGDRYYNERDGFFRGQNWRGQLFERVRRDLDYASSNAYRGGDQRRIDRTRQELDELQGKLSAGRYDQHELDDVIGTLHRVVEDNRLAPRDRDMLTDDLNRLRDFRARHDEYGARQPQR